MFDVKQPWSFIENLTNLGKVCSWFTWFPSFHFSSSLTKRILWKLIRGHRRQRNRVTFYTIKRPEIFKKDEKNVRVIEWKEAESRRLEETEEKPKWNLISWWWKNIPNEKHWQSSRCLSTSNCCSRCPWDNRVSPKILSPSLDNLVLTWAMNEHEAVSTWAAWPTYPPTPLTSSFILTWHSTPKALKTAAKLEDFHFANS